MGLMSTPFYNTVNMEQDPTDNMWATVEYNIPIKNTATFCGDTIEEGNFTVAFFGQPGIGDDVLLTAAEADMKFLYRQMDVSGVLTLTNISAPMDFRQGEWFVVEFMVDYEFYDNYYAVDQLQDIDGNYLFDINGSPLQVYHEFTTDNPYYLFDIDGNQLFDINGSPLEALP
jgi:hypothetical protein